MDQTKIGDGCERHEESETHQSLQIPARSIENLAEETKPDAVVNKIPTGMLTQMRLSPQAKGSGWDGFDKMVDENLLPRSFEEVFHLMDFLLDDDKAYHRVLFVEAGSRSNGKLDGKRKGIRTRQMLRNLKKRDPQNAAVSWHRPKKAWIPPTKAHLKVFAELLATFT